MAESQDRLSAGDWTRIGQFIRDEKSRRKTNRHDLEQLWKEIDRQVDMIPLPREISDGEEADWLPNTELPLQFNALEAIAADARSLKFPRGTQWFEVTAEISDEYLARWEENRLERPFPVNEALSRRPDQELANILVKATMDHFHRLWDFRGASDLLDVEAIKYGTFIPRVRPVRHTKFSHDFRGETSDSSIGPAVIPCSVKTTYLDDTPSAVMHEGITTSPSVIRESWQRLSDLERAAKVGGPSRGWIARNVKKLRETPKTDGQKDQVELLEFEGDLVVPRSRKDSIFLPNVIVTTAVFSDAAQPVRFRENPTPFRSYAPGTYMRDDVDSPYGTSPLMKGQPIQEAATLAFNAMMGVAAHEGNPSLAYDRNDPGLAATGGPDFYPGSRIPTDSPNAIEKIEVGDLPGLQNVYLELVNQYEDLTGVNDPRRGQPAKSHTTGTSSELELNRTIARTDDFVVGQEQGPYTNILYMEWEIIKSTMKTPIPIVVNGGGIDGFVMLSASDLPDKVDFRVVGSAGPLRERERANAFFDATDFAIATSERALQQGTQVTLNWEEIIATGYERAGIDNPSKFVVGAEELPPEPEGEPAVQGNDQGAQGGTPAQVPPRAA